MSSLVIVRIAYLHEGVLGVFACNRAKGFTLERPWLDNEHDVSCIPCGTYTGKVVERPDGERRVLLSGVPAREGIEVHIGNRVSDSHGCIVVGKSYSLQPDGFFLRESTDTMNDVLAEIGPGESVTVVVTNADDGHLEPPRAPTEVG